MEARAGDGYQLSPAQSNALHMVGPQQISGTNSFRGQGVSQPDTEE